VLTRNISSDDTHQHFGSGINWVVDPDPGRQQLPRKTIKIMVRKLERFSSA